MSLIISWFRRCCFHFLFWYLGVWEGKGKCLFAARGWVLWARKLMKRRGATGRPETSQQKSTEFEYSEKYRATWEKSKKIKIGSTRLDSNPIRYKKYWINSTWSKSKKKKLDQLDLIQIQNKTYWINLSWSRFKIKILYQIFTIQRSKNPLIFGFCRPLLLRIRVFLRIVFYRADLEMKIVVNQLVTDILKG